MMMFAGAAAAALDVLASLASSAKTAASRAPQNGAAAQGFDLAEAPAAAEPKAGSSAAGPVPALSPDTMNALLQSLLDDDQQATASVSDAKAALSQNMKLIAREAQARGAAMRGQSVAISA